MSACPLLTTRSRVITDVIMLFASFLAVLFSSEMNDVMSVQVASAFTLIAALGALVGLLRGMNTKFMCF